MSACSNCSYVVQDCLSDIWTSCHLTVVIAVRNCLSPITKRMARRARERAPQARDVTTELSTAPGEFDPRRTDGAL